MYLFFLQAHEEAENLRHVNCVRITSITIPGPPSYFTTILLQGKDLLAQNLIPRVCARSVTTWGPWLFCYRMRLSD